MFLIVKNEILDVNVGPEEMKPLNPSSFYVIYVLL